jgi:uncharacterized 2Fe-2S/4Fe-4S cluster protein (DUF4445 family)
VRLQFSPSGIDVKVPGGVTVFDAASWNGIAIDSTCGGHGTCRKCKVQITEGEAPLAKLDSRAFSPDELRDGWRLACRIQTAGDLSIEVPPLQTRPKAATVGVGRQVILRPSIVKRFLQLEEATLSDQRTDIQRVLDAMDDLELTTSISVLRTIGKVLRSSNWEITAVIADSELIAVEPGDTTGRRFAIAYDLGTTTVVANLLDIQNRAFGQNTTLRQEGTQNLNTRLGTMAGLQGQDFGQRSQQGLLRVGQQDPDRFCPVRQLDRCDPLDLPEGL